MISFIIPAKNASKYIGDCLKPFIDAYYLHEFEVIIIDDNSEDDTFDLSQIIAQPYQRIKVVKNPGVGKVQAINFGYSISNGKIIKLVAADDVILADIFSILENQSIDEAIFHDSTLTDEKLVPLAHFASNPAIVNATFEETIKKILSPPSGMWCLPRMIAAKIFPMPEKIPYEDVWFAFVIKKYARRIVHIPRSHYLYRQHGNQTFGGVLNFSEKFVRFRANRLRLLLPIIKDSEIGKGLPEIVFDSNTIFFSYIADEKWRLKVFIKLNASFTLKLRFIMILFFPRFSERLIAFIWSLRSKKHGL